MRYVLTIEPCRGLVLEFVQGQQVGKMCSRTLPADFEIPEVTCSPRSTKDAT